MKAMNPDGTVPDPMPPTVWTTYLSTDNVDGTLKSVTDAGGGVMMGPVDVMELGRMAIVTDPTGAVVGLWQPGTFDGAGIVNEHGALTWNELATNDTAAAAEFYSRVLPLTTGPTDLLGAEGYTTIRVDGREVGGMMSLDQHPAGTPPHWLTYFHADDVDAIAAAAGKAGGKVIAPPFDMPHGPDVRPVRPPGRCLRRHQGHRTRPVLTHGGGAPTPLPHWPTRSGVPGRVDPARR